MDISQKVTGVPINQYVERVLFLISWVCNKSEHGGLCLHIHPVRGGSVIVVCQSSNRAEA